MDVSSCRNTCQVVAKKEMNFCPWVVCVFSTMLVSHHPMCISDLLSEVGSKMFGSCYAKDLEREPGKSSSGVRFIMALSLCRD